MMWKVYFTKHAQKDAKKLKAAGLKNNAETLFDIIKNNPFQNPHSHEVEAEDCLLVLGLGLNFLRYINTIRELIQMLRLLVVFLVSGRRKDEGRKASSKQSFSDDEGSTNKLPTFSVLKTIIIRRPIS